MVNCFLQRNTIKHHLTRSFKDMNTNISQSLPEKTTQRSANRDSIADLDWSKLSSGGGAPSDIQKSLTIQSDALNTEIIDFLLQWEEGDVGISINSLSAAFDAKRLQETYEVLDALNHVDKELEEVDGWLMEQIQCLSLIQSRLVVIEKESGTLEKGYQNLKSIQDMTESLVQGLSLSAEDERVLSTKPEQVLEAAYKQNSFDDTTEIILPLLIALRNIKKALALTGGEVPGISIRQWKQLQSLTAVSKQRQKLLELSKFFCNKFAPFLCGVFGAVLKHRSLHEQPVKRVKKQRIHGVEIKHFSFEVAIDDGLKFSRILTNATDRALFGTRKTDGSSSREPPLTLRPNKDINEDNVALHAQSNYHEALGGFVPLLALVLELSSSTVVSLSTAYVTNTAERFYVPLFRVVFQHLRLLVISSKASVVTMANIQRFRHSSGLDFDVPLKFLPSSWLASGRGDGGSPTMLNTWAAFGTAMLIIAPLIKKEQMFFLSLFTSLDVTGMGQQVLSRNDMEGSDLPPKSMAEEMMDVLFASLMSKLQKLCGLIPSNSATAATGGHEAVDGMETIAILVVLQQFMNDHLGILPSFLGVSTTSNGLLNPPLMSQVGTMATTSTSMMAKPLMEDYSTYLVSMLFTLRQQLLLRLKTFMTEQMTWIKTQKSDPKKAGVALPVAKFPSFVRQVLEMTGGQIIDFAEELLYNLAKELLQWIESIASLNEKYMDIVKVQNFGFFALAIGPMGVPSLEKFVNYAAQQRKDAEARYVLWMVSYSFPQLSALMARMDSVGTRVREEELALYVRRKDVIAVVKEIDGKLLVGLIEKMYKRLEKHCASPDDHDLDLVAALWKKIRDRVISILQKLEEAASASYQIELAVTPKMVKESFNKFKRQ